jgi:hypothetical protein
MYLNKVCEPPVTLLLLPYVIWAPLSLSSMPSSDVQALYY